MLRLSRAETPHPNIVRTIAARSDRIAGGHGGVAVVFRVIMEACTRGSLLDRVNQSVGDGLPIPDAEVVRSFGCIASATAYLHALSPPLAHRDLKLENVLVTGDGQLRLCDFGSVCDRSGPITGKEDRVAEEERIQRFTTPHFRAPEMLDLYSRQPIDTRVDVWALGCVLFSLAYNRHPFPEAAGVAILAANYKVPSSPPRPQAIITLIRACLAPRPEQRPTADAVFGHCRALFRALKERGAAGDAARTGAGLPALTTADGTDALEIRPEARRGPDDAGGPAARGSPYAGGLPAPAGQRERVVSGRVGGEGGGRTRTRRGGKAKEEGLDEQMARMGLGGAKMGGAAASKAARRRRQQAAPGGAAAAPGRRAPAPAAAAAAADGDAFGFDDEGTGGSTPAAAVATADADAFAFDDDEETAGDGTGGDDAFGFDDEPQPGAGAGRAGDDAFGFDDEPAAGPTGAGRRAAPSDDAFGFDDEPAAAPAAGRAAPSDDAFGFDSPSPAPAAGAGFGDDSFGFDSPAPAPRRPGGPASDSVDADVGDILGFQAAPPAAPGAGDEELDLFAAPAPAPAPAGPMGAAPEPPVMMGAQHRPMGAMMAARGASAGHHPTTSAPGAFRGAGLDALYQRSAVGRPSAAVSRSGAATVDGAARSQSAPTEASLDDLNPFA